MRLILLTVLTMCAFASNSLLNRLAVESGHADPGAFALVRTAAGAAMLVALVLIRRRTLILTGKKRLIGAGSLALYMLGFSSAYLTLDAGAGALILFGVVQMSMLAISAARGTVLRVPQLAGAGVALAGLAVVLWPGGGALVDVGGAALMAAAGLGWGIYTLAGRGEPDPLAATAANFCLALPVTALALLVAGAGITGAGILLAVLSGAVTSGLGYALWYAVLPRLQPAMAATVQLSVPPLAVIGGVTLLGETVGLRFVIGAALVVGGIALSSRPAPRPAARS
ncbi:DMT family transporter [Pukyongiella litopenaei]|uniref:DMT family transporter n=1 Tax=Pukyongiella litopenaei TaxID=2605946 RepID=A0A2S0MRE7_9RHOB|nr:DMT family transporter [Pukyongiella litopenaei]AVO38469.1 DMT family transporter [Pukyongiella litopenaei]